MRFPEAPDSSITHDIPTQKKTANELQTFVHEVDAFTLHMPLHHNKYHWLLRFDINSSKTPLRKWTSSAQVPRQKSMGMLAEHCQGWQSFSCDFFFRNNAAMWWRGMAHVFLASGWSCFNLGELSSHAAFTEVVGRWQAREAHFTEGLKQAATQRHKNTRQHLPRQM